MPIIVFPTMRDGHIRIYGNNRQYLQSLVGLIHNLNTAQNSGLEVIDSDIFHSNALELYWIELNIPGGHADLLLSLFETPGAA